ncbi:MAG: YhgE/Pip family protein [Leifsonia sp.]
MSTRLDRLFGRTRSQRRFRLGAVIVGVMVVPLAVAGLVTGGLASADDRIDTIPALVVNNDEMVTATAPDGTETQILAGRLLVTQLTAPGENGFDWKLSNSAEAEKAIADGSAYAVLTIPEDFSASINSISGSSPTQADLSIRTDDAHSYLAGSAAQSVGDGMTNAFGRAITEQYLNAFYTNLASTGGSLSSAADGATQVSDGVAGLAGGLDQLAGGASSAASGAASAAGGASELADGIDSYTGGVDSLAAGLQSLAAQTAQLGSLGTGVAGYTQAVSGTAAQLDALTKQVLAGTPPTDLAAQLATISGTLDAVAGQGPALAAGTSGLGALSTGIAQTAAGANQLAAGSPGLRSGADGLASGVGALSDGLASLTSGTAASASGAHSLADGAGSLAQGLTDGAAQASALGDIDAEKTASVVAQPVTVTSTRANPITGIGEVIGMVFVPIGLWIGALAVFLLLRPLSSMALQSTASTGRLVIRGLARASGIAVVQALLVVGLLHTALGVNWGTLPATLSFAVLMALAFAAIHQFLTVAFGRVGIVVSLLLVIVQLTSSGGIYPVEILARPYQVITPFLPLTWAVQGMQQIVAGVGGASVAASAAGLAAIGLLSVVGSLIAVARRRGARSWGFALARG